MKPMHSIRTSLVVLLLASLATSVVAQKSGGTLRFPLRENPSSASLHEESSIMKAEFGEVEEPVAPGTVGSSTMPQKRNPKLCQNIIAAAAESAAGAGIGADDRHAIS